MKPRIDNGVLAWTIAGALIVLSIILATCMPAKAQSYPYIEYLGTEISDSQILNTYYVHCGDTDYPKITVMVTFFSQVETVVIDLHDACESKVYLDGAIRLVEIVGALAEAPQPVVAHHLYLPMVQS